MQIRLEQREVAHKAFAIPVFHFLITGPSPKRRITKPAGTVTLSIGLQDNESKAEAFYIPPLQELDYVIVDFVVNRSGTIPLDMPAAGGEFEGRGLPSFTVNEHELIFEVRTATRVRMQEDQLAAVGAPQRISPTA